MEPVRVDTVIVLPCRTGTTAEPVRILDVVAVENTVVFPCDVEKMKFVTRRVEVTMLETSNVPP